MKSIETRLQKLEATSLRREYPYVISVSYPSPTAEERAQMASHTQAGRPFAVVPHKCGTTDEWLSRYGIAVRSH